MYQGKNEKERNDEDLKLPCQQMLFFQRIVFILFFSFRFEPFIPHAPAGSTPGWESAIFLCFK